MEYAINVVRDQLDTDIYDAGKTSGILVQSGVDASAEAVIISGGGLTKEAALTFAILEKAGQKKISLFIDPEENWEQKGFKLINENSQVALKEVKKPEGKNNFNLRNGILVNGQEIAKGIFPRVIISCGENEPAKFRNERTVHVLYRDLLNGDGTPKIAKDVWNILQKAGVPRYAELVCYSDDPGEAAVVYFILKLMGYPDIKILVP